MFSPSNSSLRYEFLGCVDPELALSRSLNELLPEDVKKPQLDAFQYTRRAGSKLTLSLYNRWNLPPYPEALRAVQRMISSIGVTFYLFEKEQILDLTEKVYAAATTRRDSNAITAIELHEVLISIAVGAQYEIGFPPETREQCFESVRYQLDECLEEDEIRSIRLLTMVALYQILEKRMSCWSYILTALSIARTNGLHLKLDSYAHPTWIQWKRLWMTLIFLESWLAASRGRMLSTHIIEDFQEIARDIGPLTTSDITACLQFEIVKIGVLSGQVLRDVHLTPSPSLSTIGHYMAKMEAWFSNLPEFLRLKALIEGNVCGTQQRASMLLGHCLYSSAIVLLTRRVFLELILWQQGPERPKNSWIVSSDGSFNDAMQYSKACISAANQTGRVIGLLLSQQMLVKRCCVTIYAAFNSSLILLFSAYQKKLGGLSLQSYAEYCENARKCLDALEYSADEDQLSAYYLNVLAPFRKVLNMDFKLTTAACNAHICDISDTYYPVGVAGIPLNPIALAVPCFQSRLPILDFGRQLPVSTQRLNSRVPSKRSPRGANVTDGSGVQPLHKRHEIARASSPMAGFTESRRSPLGPRECPYPNPSASGDQPLSASQTIPADFYRPSSVGPYSRSINGDSSSSPTYTLREPAPQLPESSIWDSPGSSSWGAKSGNCTPASSIVSTFSTRTMPTLPVSRVASSSLSPNTTCTNTNTPILMNSLLTRKRSVSEMSDSSGSFPLAVQQGQGRSSALAMPHTGAELAVYANPVNLAFGGVAQINSRINTEEQKIGSISPSGGRLNRVKLEGESLRSRSGSGSGLLTEVQGEVENEAEKGLGKGTNAWRPTKEQMDSLLRRVV